MLDFLRKLVKIDYPNMNRTDEQIISDYLKGDKESLEILIKRYLKPIYGFIYKYLNNVHDAEDIAQETFVRTWKNLKKFDKEKSFKTWIFTIAKNISIDFLRKKSNVPFSDFEDEDGFNAFINNMPDLSPSPNKIVEQKEASDVLISAMDELSLKNRTALYLRYNNDMSFREISESLNEPIHTVKSRCRRGLSALKKIISK